MHIINISKNKRILKSIAYGSFFFGSFFEITTAAHASALGTSSFALDQSCSYSRSPICIELLQNVRNGNITEVSKLLATIGDEKAQIDALIGTVNGQFLHPVNGQPCSGPSNWPIFFEAVARQNILMVEMLLNLFRRYPKALAILFSICNYGTILGHATDFGWIKHPENLPNQKFKCLAKDAPENVLDLLLGTAYDIGIFSNNPDQPYPTDNNPGDYPPNTSPFKNAEAAKESLMPKICEMEPDFSRFFTHSAHRTFGKNAIQHHQRYGFSGIRIATKYFGKEFGAKCMKYKRQAIEFDE
jgi:hypothetical protein